MLKNECKLQYLNQYKSVTAVPTLSQAGNNHFKEKLNNN